MTTPLFVSVELGGTKTIVAVAHDALVPLAIERFPTTDGPRTLAEVTETLRGLADRHGRIAGIGIAAFGPLRLDRQAGDWGMVLTTPKVGWSGTPIAATIARAIAAQVKIETDVNAAALGERAWGAARGCDELAYLTIGTGIGGGLVLGGHARHGILHPELGHIRVARHREDHFAGACRIHGDCLEGLASGPAIEARLGRPLDQFRHDHPFREIISFYIAQACLNLTLIAGVERIVIGRGVMGNLNLHATVTQCLATLLGDYSAAFPKLPDILAPALENSGLMGGFLLAQSAVEAAGSS